ncbi:hypothetical protein E2C01_065863 [Portunus trituberculatus]|uniref:Uncharacterized protein n=1 Tax=Portunus trituberculatus TaxID=210409 RepID=A0A5B7HN95_PORTR|nr:hypothetical protein [Portunus trituberculatus]
METRHGTEGIENTHSETTRRCRRSLKDKRNDLCLTSLPMTDDDLQLPPTPWHDPRYCGHLFVSGNPNTV